MYEHVQLFLACKKLKDLDVMSKSDPMVMVYEKNQKGTFQEIGRTERKNNNLNPIFDKNILINFYFEKTQHLQFKVIDDDGQGSFDLIGSFDTTMGKIMGSKNQTLIGDLKVDGKSEKRG